MAAVNPLQEAMQAAMAQAMAQAMPAMLAQMFGQAAPAAPATPAAPAMPKQTDALSAVDIPDITGTESQQVPLRLRFPDGSVMSNVWVKPASFTSGNVGYRIGGGVNVRANGRPTGYRWTFVGQLILSQPDRHPNQGTADPAS